MMLIQVSRSYVHSYCRPSALFALLFIDDEVRRTIYRSPVTCVITATCVWPHSLSWSITVSFSCPTSSHQPFPSRM